MLNDLKNHGTVLIFFLEKTFTVDPVFKKQNDRIITLRNDVSEHHRMSTIKHPATVMMIAVVASYGEKMPLLWFERGYRQTSAIYKKSLEDKSFSMSQEDH